MSENDTRDGERMSPDFTLWGIGDLAVYLGGSEDSFTGDLLRLIAKADPGNLERLAIAFPREYRARLAWMSINPPTVANMDAVLAGER